MAGSADPHDSLERSVSDAVISVQGVQFNVYKLILCDCSTYFRGLFLHHSAPDRKTFEFTGLSAATIQLIIEFAYTGSVTVTADNVQELLQAADKFIINGIKQACCNFLLERLSSENCIGIWQLCNICFCPELQQKVYRYLLIHFEEVVYGKEFQQLSVQELSGILESDELNVRKEKTLCGAIFKWINYEPAERQQHLAVLLSKVRLALTSQSFIFDLMNTAAVSSNAECMEIVQQAQKLKIDMFMCTPSLFVCSDPAARPRLPRDFLFAIGGSVCRKKKGIIITEVYDFQADRWNAVSDHGAHPYDFHGTVYCNGSVYCVGGEKDDDPTNVTHRLALKTHTWHEVAPMIHCRCHPSVAVLDGFIYAIGGSSWEQPLPSAERYDPQTNQWRFIASMHEPKSFASATSLHNKIYNCGGINEYGGVSTCECYCPETNQWTMITSMSNKRFLHGIIAYKDLIFAVGGEDSVEILKSVEAYNPRTKTWQVVPSMLNSRSCFGIGVIDNKLFVVGGVIGFQEFSKSVQYYDMSTNLWYEACELKILCTDLSCCVVSGLPNVASYVINRDNLRRPAKKKGLVKSRHAI